MQKQMSRQLSFVLNKNNNDDKFDRQINNEDDDNAAADVLYNKCVNNYVEIYVSLALN